MVKHCILLPDGTVLSSGAGTECAIRSVRLTQTVNDGEELTPGSAVAAILEVELLAPSGLSLTAGQEVTLYQEDEAGNRSKQGIFILEKPTRPTANTMRLTGYDRLVRLDKDLTQWLNGLNGWPYTLLTFARLVCRACGLSLAAVSIPNGDHRISKFSKNGVTGRQLMKWIGQLACRFCRADADGLIRFGWYTPTETVLTPGGAHYYFHNGLRYEDYSVAPVDAVQLRLAEGSDGYLWPGAAEGANSYIISGNPLLSSVTDETASVLQTVLDELAGVSYTPCRVVIPADTEIWAGDTVTILGKDGKTVTAYVMQKTTAGQKATLECTGSQRRDSAGVISNKTTDQLVQEKLDAQTQGDIFNKLTQNGALQGLFMKDGQLYVNASYLRSGTISAELIDTANLIAQTLKSVSGSSALNINGASISLSGEHGEEFGVQNWGDGVTHVYMRQWDASGNEVGRSLFGATSLSLGGTWVNPTFLLTAVDGVVKMTIPGQSTGKALSWKDNGDGTYNLIGT